MVASFAKIGSIGPYPHSLGVKLGNDGFKNMGVEPEELPLNREMIF